MASLGTGYLYNWGLGLSGENSIPNELTGAFISGGIGVGNTFNIANVVSAPITPEVYPTRQAYGKFGFAFYNSNSQVSPLHKLEIFSSFSGTGSGSFTSGDDFIGKLYMTTNAGAFGVKNNRGFISLGQTLGTGSGIYTYPQDTFITIKKNNVRYKELDSWSGDYNLFSGNKFTGIFINNTFRQFSGNDGGAVIKDLGASKNGVAGGGLTFYEINYGTVLPVQSGRLVRQKILFQNLDAEYPKYESIAPISNKIWASYDTRTGLLNNTRNVFAYAFQFIDIVTTRDSGIVITSGGQQNPFEYLQKLSQPTVTSGFDTSFSNYIGFCFSREECPQNEPIEDAIECYTGTSISGQEYKLFVSGVLKKYASKEYKDEVDLASSVTISSGVTVSGLFTYQTGLIYFNNFVTGDRFVFNLYNFDYTGTYRKYHLNNNPLYPSLSFTLSYPQDFTGIDQLTLRLNQKLNNINQWVWYPYDCLSGEATGIFISGRLMSFEKLSGSGYQTGDKNYNNVISYRSLRNYQRGFGLSFDLINREEYIEDLYRQVFRKGFSYLIPDVIELQGLSGTGWIVLDRRIGMYDYLTGLESTKIPLDADPNLFLLSGQQYLNSDQVTGEDLIISDTGFEEILFSGGFRTLQRFKQKSFTDAPPYCTIKTFERSISIVEPTGWPASNLNPCKPEEPKESGDKEEEKPQKGEGDDKLELFLNVKRTGWLLEPTGQYLSCLTSPDYNPYKIQFSGYRIVMKNFSGLTPTGENLYLKPKDEVYISNINFWSLEPTPITIHTGKAECLIGSKYRVDVADIIAVPFNYDFEYTITGEDRTGIFKAVNYAIVYPYRWFYPTGNIVSRAVVNNPISATGFFAIGGIGGLVQPLFSGGGQLWIQVSSGSSEWITGKSVRWESSNDGINFSGFKLYNSGSGYFSGVATGNGGIGPALYTGYLPINSKYFRIAQPTTGNIGIRIGYTGWSGYYDLPYTKFVRESGRLVGNITGLINGTFAGSGAITQTFGNKYFYNPAESKVYFREDLSGDFYRSGILSGNFTVIKDYIINQELFVGGRLFSEPEYYEKYAGGLLTGFITGINYFKPNTEGIYFLTGQITGLSKSGYYRYTGVYVTGSGQYIDENNFPYYPVYTGVIQSEGTVLINFNKIKNFDIFNLNNTTIAYNTDTGTFFPPDYFSNIDNLLETINTNVDVFYATGQKLNSTGLKIRALEAFAPGISGNLIILTGNGTGFSFSSSTLTGGKTFYPRLYPTTVFSGFANGVIASTGFYTGIGSGSITGNVSTFTGIRTFTGIWDFKTGNNSLIRSFFGNNWISGNSAYLNSGRFSGLSNLRLQVLYTNELNTFDSDPTDVAQITVYDNNYDLLLNPPTGETNPFIFRITGIRNI